MTQPCPGTLADIQRGQHACYLYDSPEQAMVAVAPFVAAGLHQGERCVYVLGFHDEARVRFHLHAAGIDVEQCMAEGALAFVSQWEVSFPNGEFDPEYMIGYVRESIAAAANDGFAALRVIAEMTWALEMGVGANKLIHYEALGNHLYPDEPLVAVCMYDRSKYSAEVCQDAIRVHPFVTEGTDTFDNIYYEPPEAVIDGRTAAQRVENMLHQLRSLREAEEQRLELFRIRSAHAQAQAALLAKDDLLAILAHELRTPIASMMLQTDILNRRLENGQVDGARLRHTLQVVRRQIRKQADLIERILDHGRLAEDGHLPLEVAPFNLNTLVEEVLAQSRAKAPHHRFVFRGGRDVLVTADPIRIEQVLVNLLDNAAKYSPPETQVVVELLQAGEALSLVVQDEGPGVPPDARERVFERYYRHGNEGVGVGLGLHISREIMRRHGGELAVEDASAGARFVVRLPCAQPVAESRPRTAVGL